MLRKLLQFVGLETGPSTREQILNVFKGPNYWRSEDAVIADYFASKGIEYEAIATAQRDEIFSILMKMVGDNELDVSLYHAIPPHEQNWIVYSAFEENFDPLFARVNNFFRLPRNYVRHNEPWIEENRSDSD
ncbi:hypothetical protein JXD20_00090 [Candidatus Peregrinibacteria bacterium]|nr:hypothetical protein [Candidatus Peregrinibacteria bacterium]